MTVVPLQGCRTQVRGTDAFGSHSHAELEGSVQYKGTLCRATVWGRLMLGVVCGINTGRRCWWKAAVVPQEVGEGSLATQ